MNNEELIIEIRNGKEELKIKLIERNMPLIHYFIKKYVKVMPYELTKEDLEQAGIIGLIKALEKFDFCYRVKFITFAYRYVRGEIIRTMESCDSKTRPFSSYIKNTLEEDGDMLVEEVADYFSIDDNDAEFENKITDEIFAGELMNLLTEKQKVIFNYRYRENMTQQEIGKILGMHQVDVSREESKAKRKLNLIIEGRQCSV